MPSLVKVIKTDDDDLGVLFAEKPETNEVARDRSQKPHRSRARSERGTRSGGKRGSQIHSHMVHEKTTTSERAAFQPDSRH